MTTERDIIHERGDACVVRTRTGHELRLTTSSGVGAWIVAHYRRDANPETMRTQCDRVAAYPERYRRMMESMAIGCPG